jgi:hypothetical protein
MSQHGAFDSETPEEFPGGPNLWGAGTPLQLCASLRRPMLNARTVEFIAKPDRAKDLQDCIRGPIMEFLKRQPGFCGAFVLASHKEPRRILVLSLWETENQAVNNRWECANAIPQLVESLIDVYCRVQTYEAILARSPDQAMPASDMPLLLT